MTAVLLEGVGEMCSLMVAGALSGTKSTDILALAVLS